jgi:hypothetical protein
MCLTAEGEQERTWGPYPTLRKTLEGRRVPDRYYGPTTVSDNGFERMRRLLETAIVVREQRAEIAEAEEETGAGLLARDLGVLILQLLGAADELVGEARALAGVFRDVTVRGQEQLERELDRVRQEGARSDPQENGHRERPDDRICEGLQILRQLQRRLQGLR